MANLGYIQVVRHCNHFCGFCSNPTTPYTHTFASMKLLVDDFVRRGYFGVILTGGEPSLHPELPRVARYATERGLHVRMITNGWRLADEGGVRFGVTLLAVGAASQGKGAARHYELADLNDAVRDYCARAQIPFADQVALFAEFCAEHGCLRAPRAFPSDHSRFLYFRQEDRDPDYLAHDDTRGEVHRLRPGARVRVGDVRGELGLDLGDVLPLLRSELGQGTTFTVLLPATDLPDPVPSATTSFRLHRQPTVMVVDDDDQVRDIVGDVLRRAGFQVLAVARGLGLDLSRLSQPPAQASEPAPAQPKGGPGARQAP